MWNCEQQICGFGFYVFACIYCLICFGPLLIIIGIIVLFSAANNTRGHEVSKYNNGVKAWTNTYRNQFITVTGFDAITPPNNVFPLTPNTSPDKIKDSHTSDLTTYFPLKYVGSNGNLQPVTFNSNTIPPQYQIAFNSSDGASVFSLYFSPLTVRDYDSNALGSCSTTSSVSDSSSCINVCQTYFGTWSASTAKCTIVSIITEFCAVVSQNGAVWQLDKTYGGYGCAPSQSKPPTSDTFPVETYQAINPPLDGQNVSFGLVQFTLRSIYDPYVIAADITGGSFNFGITTGQKLSDGLIIIVVGCVFTAPAVLIVFIIYYVSKRR